SSFGWLAVILENSRSAGRDADCGLEAHAPVGTLQRLLAPSALLDDFVRAQQDSFPFRQIVTWVVQHFLSFLCFLRFGGSNCLQPPSLVAVQARTIAVAMSPKKTRPHQLLSAACSSRSSPGERGLALKTDSTRILHATGRNFRGQIDAHDER